jgi:hypothetical protein
MLYEGTTIMAQENVMQPSPITQQLAILNLRINDMLSQLNIVIKAMNEENAALKQKNADLKSE